LRKLEIAAAIEKDIAGRAEHAELTADLVVDGLRKIAFANMSDYMKPTPDGYPYLDCSGLTRDQTAALAEVTVDAYSEAMAFSMAAAISSFLKFWRPISADVLEAACAIVPARRLVADHDRLGDRARQIGCASYGAGRGNP